MVADELVAGGVRRGTALALVVLDRGVCLAWESGRLAVETTDPATVVREVAGLDPRWTWWSAADTAAPLVAAGVRPRTCWDLAAVGRLLYGLRRNDPGAVWAAAHDLPEPPLPRAEPDLLELGEQDHGPLRADGQLSAEWLRGGYSAGVEAGLRWAELALQVQRRQHAGLLALPDTRAQPRTPPLAVLTAYAESAAALLAVELERDGLPVDRDVAGRLLTAVIGARPDGPAAESAARASRDAMVLQHFPEQRVDLRNPLQVRGLLTRVGLDLPDTRSWRLTPHAATVPAVAALLQWRRAERIATTYGWSWLDRHVGPDGRLRGAWSSADAAAGRMTAQAGLHNLPAELRPAVRAEPGHVFVRADLGQVEPRVLAAVSGDPGLAAAAREDDMYSPVAAGLGCDRPTAKVAVLAAMYGQTSGAAGAALADMDRAYPRAMAYLRAAQEQGRTGRAVRTYGGRLVGADAPVDADADDSRRAARGRYVRNAVVQGAAAELFKAWAATVRDGLSRYGGRIVLCLHDELLLHVPQEHATAAAELLDRTLAGTAGWWAAGSGVRFVADVSVGASWADAH